MSHPTDLARRRRSIAVAIFEEAFSRQVFDLVDDSLESYTLHVGGRHLDLHRGDLQQIVASWHAAFDDFRFDVHRVAVDGDLAAVHATLHGAHTGPWNGLPPTGRQHTAEHMCFVRFDGVQIREVWELYDPATLP